MSSLACPVCDVEQPPVQAEPMPAPPPIDGGGLVNLERHDEAGEVARTPTAAVEPKHLDSAAAGLRSVTRDVGNSSGAGTHVLCAAIARGDRDAFGHFYEAWFDNCCAMARSLTRRDEAFCLDVVQNAMLRVVRSIKPMPTHAALARWMVRTVHSSAIDMLRSESRAKRRDRGAARSEASHQENHAGEPHMTEWLASALASLDDEERAMLRIRFAGDATLDAVGEVIGTSGDAAHGRLRRALAKMRRAADPP